jgi:hypothetical protein
MRKCKMEYKPRFRAGVADGRMIECFGFLKHRYTLPCLYREYRATLKCKTQIEVSKISPYKNKVLFLSLDKGNAICFQRSCIYLPLLLLPYKSGKERDTNRIFVGDA